MKIAIVGSRGYPDLFQMHAYLDWVCSDAEQYRVDPFHTDEGYPDPGYDPMPTLVSGGAKGVDQEAVSYGASAWGLRSIVFLPDWAQNGKAAGVIRNRLIVQEADKVVAFWDGESKGTKNTINLALEAKKHLEVIFP